MPKKIRLFRVSLDADDETTIDRIDFNDPTNSDLKNSKKENAWCLTFEKITEEGIADNQPAEQDTGDKQPIGGVQDGFKLSGIISKTDGDLGDGANQLLILLDLWDAEAKNFDNWPEGRFGFIDDNDHTNDLIPVRTGSNQIGLIWRSYTKKFIPQTNWTEIEIVLETSRGDGT